MIPRRLWPLLVSILGHALALGALVYFAVRPSVPEGDGPGRATAVMAPSLRPEGREAEPESPSEIAYVPPPIFPDVPPPERTAEPPPPVASLPALPRARAEEPAWRVDQIPLAVARRRVRPEPAEAPLRLEPIHTPRYWPREAWEQGLRGHVLVLITVSTSGAVIEATLLQTSGHDILDAAALASARQWRFQPIRKSVRARLPFNFGKRR